MEAITFSYISIKLYQTERRHMLEDCALLIVPPFASPTLQAVGCYEADQ
jgi:hypothetical protein